MLKRSSSPYKYPKYYLKAQQVWADKMSGITDGLSKNKLICILSLFVLLTSVYLIWNLYRSFNGYNPRAEKIRECSKIKSIKLKE